MIPEGESIYQSLAVNLPYGITKTFLPQAFGLLNPIADSDVLELPKERRVTFVSYYPYREDIDARRGIIPVDVTDQTGELSFGLLYSNDAEPVVYPDSVIIMGYYHQMTKLYLRVHARDDSNINLTTMRAYLDGMPLKGDFNLGNGRFANLLRVNSLKLTTMSAMSQKAEFQAVVIPHSESQFPNRRIRLQITEDKTVLLPTDTVYQHGQIYHYDIYLGNTPDDVVVKAEITEWDNGDEYNYHIYPDD
jgi:hypothetical protein